MQRFVVGTFMVIVSAAVLCLMLWLTSGSAVKLSPHSGLLSGMRTLTLELEGPRNGLKSVKVVAVQAGKAVDVLAKDYAGLPKARETFTLATAGLKDGPVTIQVTASGVTLFGLQSRTAVLSQPFTYDSTPPVISVLTIAHNIIRGGAGLVVYTVSKEVEKTGVTFGGRFAQGYKQEGNTYACLFPFPWDMTPEQYTPRVIAIDKAGNERTAGINFHLIVKPFSTDTINLTEPLLTKINEEFREKYPQAKTPLEVFLKVNGELRTANRNALYDYAKLTSPTPLWDGIFLRMPNTAPLGGFAQTRTYLYNKEKVDEQTHLGFDLASVIHAQVPAANRGKVVFAGDFGIYGQCVVIDHGLGLQTLYAHLNQISTKVGDTVEKGQIIGNTGATGMAAGDHLHYGVTVAGVEVNPVEWWDAHWMKDNIAGKLATVKRASGK